MRKAGQLLDRLIARLSYLGIALGAISLVAMTLLITLNVALRYGLNKPINYVDEISGYLFVLMVYMALSYTTRREAHISVDLVVRRLPQKVRGGLDVVTSLLYLAVFSVYLRFVWRIFRESLQTGEVSNSGLEMPMWIPQLFLVVGLGFLSLEIIVRIAKKVMAFQKELKAEVAREHLKHQVSEEL